MQGSANGYVLEVEGTSQRAYWAAPFFVLRVTWDYDDNCGRVPGSADVMLTHCADAAHARSVLGHGGRLLNAQFEEIDADEMGA